MSSHFFCIHDCRVSPSPIDSTTPLMADLKGLRDLNRCGSSSSLVTIVCRGWSVEASARRHSNSVAPSRRMELGWIPATTGSWSMGVACKQPVIVQRQLFIGTSTSRVCALGIMRQHSAQLVHTLMPELWCVVLWYLHPQVVPAKHLISAERDDTFPLSPSRCFLKVREQSSLTPR